MCPFNLKTLERGGPTYREPYRVGEVAVGKKLRSLKPEVGLCHFGKKVEKTRGFEVKGTEESPRGS